MISAVFGLIMMLAVMVGLSAAVLLILNKIKPHLSRQKKALGASLGAAVFVAVILGVGAIAFGGISVVGLIPALLFPLFLALAGGYPVCLAIARKLEKPRIDPDIFR